MEVNPHIFTLTKKQEAKLVDLVNLFYTGAMSREVPNSMLLLLSGVRRAIVESEQLEQHQMDVIIWMLELVFSQMGENELDPVLEQVFHKIAGYWYVEPPWYVRIKDFNLQGELNE